MFGLSFGEVVLLVLIALVVVGPRNLPQMMRTIGRTIARAKRMTIDIREQTGIDEILKAEGIQREVEQLRALATGRILDVDLDDDLRRFNPPRWREYPRIGADSYGALADDETMYLPQRVEPEEAKPDAPIARAASAAVNDPFAAKDELNAAVPSEADAPAAPKPEETKEAT